MDRYTSPERLAEQYSDTSKLREPALEYWRSMRDDPDLEAAMRPRIDEIIRKEGTFREPLIAGCFVADL